MAITTSLFRLANAQAFIDNVQTNGNFYIAIGRPFPWPDDLLAPSPIDNQSTNPMYWKESMAAKKVQASDVVQACRRNNWESGVVYTQYDSTINIIGTPFFVMNSEYDVYKCINNNGGAQSVDMPTGTSTSIFQTSDGYQWKYMYTVSQADAIKYKSNVYIPVRTNSVVSAAAINGGIHNIKVTAGGSGYTSANIVVTGDGTGFAGTVTLNSGVVTDIVVTDPGTGYTIAHVEITGNGTGATADAIISPPGGHGFDAESELNSYYVMLSNELSFNIDDDFPRNNDYRRILMIKDPTLQGTSTVASGSTYNLSTTYEIEHVSGSAVIETDDTFTGVTSGAVLRVIEAEETLADPLTYSVRTVQDLEASVATMTTENITTSNGGTWTINSITQPELNHGSGSIIYVEQRRPIMRADDQTEVIITTLIF